MHTTIRIILNPVLRGGAARVSEVQRTASGEAAADVAEARDLSQENIAEVTIFSIA